MRWLNYAIFFTINILLIGLFSCKTKPEQKQDYPSFELEELIDEQIELLSKEEFVLHKTTVLNAKVEEVQLKPDSTSWRKELSIFKSADINKPGLIPFYTYTQLEINGLLEDQYVLNDSGRSETTYLRILKHRSTRQISRITAVQKVVNPIYESSRKMELYFKESEGAGILLDSFSINGYQKMVSQDSVVFFTSGKITY